MFQLIKKLAKVLKCGKSFSYHRPIDWAKLWSFMLFMAHKHPQRSSCPTVVTILLNESYSCGESSHNRYYLFFVLKLKRMKQLQIIGIYGPSPHENNCTSVNFSTYKFVSWFIVFFIFWKNYPNLVVLLSIIKSQKVVERISKCINVNYDTM